MAKNEVTIVSFNKKGSIRSATVKINVEIDVMIGFSGSEEAAQKALLSQAIDQLRSDLIGDSDD